MRTKLTDQFWEVGTIRRDLEPKMNRASCRKDIDDLLCYGPQGFHLEFRVYVGGMPLIRPKILFFFIATPRLV